MSRIAIVIHSFDRGGSGKVAAYLARGFADAGHEVELMVFVPGGAIEPIVLPGLAGIPVRYLRRASPWRPLDLALGVAPLAAALRHFRPEIVMAAANNAALPTALAFRRARVPNSRLYLKTTNPIASSRHLGALRRLRRAGYAAIFPWTTAVLTLSSDEADEMAAAFPRSAGRFRAVANPYVTEAMLALPGEVRRDVEKTVIAVARLTRQKRLDRLINAFALVRTLGAQLVILGEGEDRESLVERINELGLRQRVDLRGHVADVVPALHAADLFVLTSDYEGLPAAVLEAMAANCPVLATPCFPSARSLLAAPGCGVIDDPAPVALAAQIDAALARPRPTALRAIAERYSIAAGIADHLTAMDASPASDRCGRVTPMAGQPLGDGPAAAARSGSGRGSPPAGPPSQSGG